MIKLAFNVDCEKLGEAVDAPTWLHRSDGRGCKRSHFHFWFLPTWGAYAIMKILVFVWIVGV